MIELRKQNDPAFIEVVRGNGCRFFTLLAIPQLHLSQPLSPDQIMEIFFRGTHIGLGGPGRRANEGVMDRECRMGTQEHLVMNWAFQSLGRPGMHARQVGKLVNGEPVFWGGKDQPWQYIVGHWDTGSIDGHWTLRDAVGVEIYDPWEPAFSPTQHQVKKILTDKQYLYRVWEEEAA